MVSSLDAPTELVSVRFSANTLNRIDTRARNEKRSRANLVRKIVEEYLEA